MEVLDVNITFRLPDFNILHVSQLLLQQKGIADTNVPIFSQKPNNQTLQGLRIFHIWHKRKYCDSLATKTLTRQPLYFITNFVFFYNIFNI